MADLKQKAKLLASIPPIMSSVMKYLTSKQLNSCSQVCKLWRSLSETEKKRRKNISWYFYCCCQCCRHVNNGCFDQDSSSNQTDCLSHFRDYLNSLPMEPQFMLIFCTKSIIRESKIYLPKPILKRKRGEGPPPLSIDSPNLKHPVIGSLLPYLPKGCDVGFCTSEGITGTLSDNSITKEVESCPSISMVLLPRLPGIEMYRFMLNGFTVNENFVFSEHTGIPEDKEVKCLLVFVYDRIADSTTSAFNKIIGHYVKKQDRKIAVGGAYVHHMFFPRHKPRRRNQSYGIAFAGDNIKAASVMINSDIDTREKVIEQLQVLKKTDLLNGTCIAFMFTCISRGVHVYNEYNVESSIFRQMFPSVPLCGVFGFGEIGINYIPNIATEEKCYCHWRQSYTTVFVLISITEPV